MVDREIFLKKRSLEEALGVWQSLIKTYVAKYPLKEEKISVFDSLGRVSSQEVVSKLSSPSYNASAVDGFAVHSSETFLADIKNPKELVIGVGAIPVNTGDAMPDGFDSVVMIEDVFAGNKLEEINESKINSVKVLSNDNFQSGESIKVPFPVAPFRNVRLIGDDFSAGDTLVHPNQKIRPEHISIMLAGGVDSLYVKEKPVVCIIPTGEEIKHPFEKLEKGDIFDTNSYMLKAMVEDSQGIGYVTDVLPNDENKIANAIKYNFDKAHIIVVIGGSAKGTKDLVSKIVSSVGKVLVHGLSIQPGKPLLIGSINDKPILGMPGFPVSCFLDAQFFLKSAIEIFTEPNKTFGSIDALVLRPIPSSVGVKEFIRVKVADVSGQIIAVPLKKGAGVLSSVTEADGIFAIPENLEGIESGTRITVDLFRPENYVRNQLLFIGSNDPLLNALFDFTARRNPDFRVGVVNAGSFGGLLAMENGECSISSVHLFDAETGTYNKTFIKKYLSKEALVINFSLRKQGLIVKKNNPKNINSISDLVRPDVKFVNRQKGSGTRVLFDYLLRENGIDEMRVNGYDYEEYTHLGVANAVKLGNADCGVGIEYVARLFDLDFVNIKDEEYDLIVLKEELRKPDIRLVLETIKSEDFRKFARNFKGYEFLGGFNEKTNQF
ncbi:MAG: molybdopterin biosynthesis protein [Caldisericaceae bacterium]